MAQYIDKDKVETILRNLWKEDDGHNSEHRICYNKALQEVQCEIDTLEVKEVDLDNELDFIKDAYYYFTSDERSSMKKVARHFFELGLKAKVEYYD